MSALYTIEKALEPAVELENKKPLPDHPAVELLIKPIEAVPSAGTPLKLVPPIAVIFP